ncbi:selenium metabolism-associated LysR family transcriptional regulator [Phascolarctobacterium succinatutens]|uniref:selenium metabolism-associated LysR family transcriptional regulator n=1 Tax=Phascolarctobacterium succinatutens TaxID=626940 RepID=UPI0040266FB7
MDFKQLQSFVTVVQEESFTQAAGRLFVSQSTVSTHIHQLESELNTKLILRTTKSLQITPKGRELYEYALNILELKERMIQACSIESRRIIHLGASTIPSAYILPQLLADFGKSHQDIYFIIHQSDSQGIINGLKDGLFNLGFIGMSCEDSDFCCQPFCKDRMVVITPVNEHFLQYKQQKENVLPELLREPLILREKGSGSKKMADNFLAHSGISEDELQIIARVNDQETIKNLVAGGMGISIISEKAAHNFLLEKRLLAFELPQAFSERSLYLIYRKNYLLPSYVKEFFGFISQSKL